MMELAISEWIEPWDGLPEVFLDDRVVCCDA
jgi:hypothetical protein